MKPSTTATRKFPPTEVQLYEQMEGKVMCVINGTEKCCGRPWWEDDDWNDNGLPPESDEGWEGMK